MSDIITKAQRSSNVTEDHALPPWQRVRQALETLSGLILSDLNDDARVAIEAELVTINQISANHAIESEADYKNLTDAESEVILRRIGTVNRLCVDSEAERVMRELDTAGRKLPVAAFEEVREHRDIFVPLLTQSLERSIVRVRNGEKSEGGSSFFALFLLTELKVNEAFPILREALRLPGEGPFELFGDAVHELVPPLLAQFSHGNIDSIGEIVGDPNLDLYVRWSATQAYKYLVRDELISRQVAIDALHVHFQDCVKNEDYDLLAPLACALGDLAAEPALETIRSAYDRNQVNDEIVDFRFIESQIKAGEDTVKKTLEHCLPTGMPDTTAELSDWAAFQEEPLRPRSKPKALPSSDPLPRRQLDDLVRTKPVTTIRVDAKVGRNDRCPCGSGKKYKKCCGRS